MDIYRKNLEALRKTHPHLVQMVENTSLDYDNIIVSRSLSGQLQVTWKRSDRLEVVITDSNDLSNIPEKAKNLLAQEKGTRVMLLLGFGLGGYPKALHENLKGDGTLCFKKCSVQQKNFSWINGPCRGTVKRFFRQGTFSEKIIFGEITQFLPFILPCVLE